MKLAHACPGCGRRQEPGVVVCVHCGHDARTGSAHITRVARLRERGARKRAARAEGPGWLRWAPLAAGLAQAAAIAALALAVSGDPAAERVYRQGATIYIAVAGFLMLAYAWREDGVWGLLYPGEAWLLLYGDDCNPWLLGVVINAMLAGAGAAYLVLTP